MKPALQIAPLALLFAGAFYGVWKGFDSNSGNKPNSKINQRKKRK